MNRQRRLAIAGVTGAMLVGAGTGVVLNMPSGAGASNAPARAATVVTDPTDPASTAATTSHSGTATTPDDDGTPTPAHDHADFLKTSLDKLVAAGTITQAQEDAIIAELKADRPAPGDHADGAGPIGDHGHGGPGGRHGGPDGHGFAKGLEAAATALGITTDELKTELEAGKTIADVATDKGVDVQKVIDVIVAEETANITERVTNAVNGIRPTPPADAPDATATTTPTTDTTGS